MLVELVVKSEIMYNMLIADDILLIVCSILFEVKESEKYVCS